MTKISHLSNTCTNVIKVSQFDYTCIIKIKVDNTKKKEKNHIYPLHFQST